MREVLEGPGEGQVIGFGGRSKDVVHPRLVCKKKNNRERHVHSVHQTKLSEASRSHRPQQRDEL